MGNILSLLNNKDAILAFVSDYVQSNNRPCPTEAIYEKFGEIKDTITLMKMQGDVIGQRGRNGGLIVASEYEDYIKGSNDRKADKLKDKPVSAKALNKMKRNGKKITSKIVKSRVKTVTPDVFDTAITAQNAVVPAVDSATANKLAADVKDIVKEYKTKTKRAKKEEVVPSIDDEEIETKGYSDDSDEDDSDDKDAIDVIEESTADSRFDDEQDEEFDAMISDIEDTIAFNRFAEE